MKNFTFSLAAALALAAPVYAGSNDQAKIAAHLAPSPTGKAPQPCARIESPPCNPGDTTLVVRGSIGQNYDVFLLVADGSPIAGVAGASFGISYNGEEGTGLDISSWTLCADLEFPGGPAGISWPGSGSGNVITWDRTNSCQDESSVGDHDAGVTTLLGVLSVYAYSHDLLSITPRQYVTMHDLQVVDCTSSASNIAYPEHVAKIEFGTGTNAFDPCFSADSLAPGTSNISNEGEYSENSGGLIKVTWIAPGDDGFEGGPANRYELRYSSQPVSINNWLSAQLAGELMEPGWPRSQESTEIRGLTPGCRYFMALKTFDNSGNESDLSNVLVVTVPDYPSSFVARIPRNGAEVWVSGNSIESDSIEFSYDGANLTISRYPIDLYPSASVTREEQLRALNSLGSSIPAIQTAVKAGRSLMTASNEWRMTRINLINRAREFFSRSGIKAASDFLRMSSLVQDVHDSGTTVYVTFSGKLVAEVYDLADAHASSLSPGRGSAELASRLRDGVRAHLILPGAEQLMVLLTGGGNVSYLAGDSREQASAQIRHLRSGGSLSTMPKGPLDRDSGALEFVRKEGARP
jgi:hypothetical protein